MKTESNKIGKLKRIKLNGYNGSYGTLNSFQCTGVFMEICTWVCPENNYKKDIDRFKHRFEREMNQYIKEELSLFKTSIIYCIDDRQTNGGEICNEDKFTLLPIEITILFSNDIIWKEHLSKFENITKKMVNYIQGYKQGLVFESKKYK